MNDCFTTQLLSRPKRKKIKIFNLRFLLAWYYSFMPQSLCRESIPRPLLSRSCRLRLVLFSPLQLSRVSSQYYTFLWFNSIFKCVSRYTFMIWILRSVLDNYILEGKGYGQKHMRQTKEIKWSYKEFHFFRMNWIEILKKTKKVGPHESKMFIVLLNIYHLRVI